MAATGSKRSTWDPTETKCIICLDFFTNPKSLPCLHTFCLECLEANKEEHGPGDEMKCPLCRQRYTIPSGGFRDLPRNIFCEENVAMRKTNSDGLSGDIEKCDACGKITASKFCIDCAQHVCDDCLKIHDNLTVSKPHTALSLSDRKKSRVYMGAVPALCKIHEDEQLKLYCNECKKPICVVCANANHKNHATVDLQTSSMEFSAGLKNAFPKLNKCIDAIAKEKTLLEVNGNSLREQITACHQAIGKRGEELKQLVDTHCETLLYKLNRIKDDKLKKIEMREVGADMQLSMMTSYKTYVQELTTNGSACAISQSGRDLLARANELQTGQVQFNKGRLIPIDVKFEKGPVIDIISGPLRIGIISVSDSVENTLVVVGLDDGSTSTQSICRISLQSSDSVMTTNSTPTYIDQHSAACIMDNTLYAVGIGIGRNELWKLNAASDWTRCANMKSGRRRHCAAVVDSTLYALGGCATANETSLNSVEAYDTRTNKWSTAGQLTHAVRSFACVNYKNSIYAFGGKALNNKDVAHVQVYDATERKCKLLEKAMPRAEFGMRGVLWGTSALLFGRLTCFIYNIEKETWLERQSYKTNLLHFGLVIDVETLFIAGGGKLAIKTDKDNKEVWTCTDKVRIVSAVDFIAGKLAVWKHHTKLPTPTMISAYGVISL